MFGVVILNMSWSQNRAIFVVFGPDRLYVWNEMKIGTRKNSRKKAVYLR